MDHIRSSLHSIGRTPSRITAFLAAICLVSASWSAAAASTPEQEPGDDASGIADIDIDAVMHEFDVSREVAKARLAFEGRFIDAVNEIAREVPSYVDSSLDPNFATISGTILLADASESEWQRAEDALEPLGNSVQLESARLTAAEEQELFDVAYVRLAWLRESGRSLSLGWSAAKDEFTVVVGGLKDGLADQDRGRIHSELRDLASTVTVREGPEDFKEDCPTNPTVTGGGTEGGRLIAECGVNDCTAGFSVRSEANPGRTGILTAAHCNDWANDTDDWWYIRMADGDQSYSTVRYADHERYDRGDIMFLREWFASATPRPRVYRYGQIWTDIPDFQWENPTHATVIAKGGQTADDEGHLWANMVGQIENNTVTADSGPNDTPPDANNRYAAVDYGDGSGSTTELSPRPGDSGSPVWIAANRHAVGIHKGGAPEWEIYSKVGYALADMGLEMLP